LKGTTASSLSVGGGRLPLENPGRDEGCTGELSAELRGRALADDMDPLGLTVHWRILPGWGDRGWISSRTSGGRPLLIAFANR